jgi:predicted PurR-regulated permease PerM/phosphoglycolate phosphatase-like HAD superfamily hydrolase
MGSRRWGNVTKIVVVVALVAIAMGLLVAFRQMITPTIVAFLLAFLLSYPVNWIQRSTGWARGAAILIVYIVLAGLASLLPVLIIPRSAELVGALEESVELLIVNLQSATRGPLLALGPLQVSVDQLFDQAGEALNNVFLVSSRNPLTIARGVTTSILTIVYVAVLTFWILKDLYKLQRIILEQIPPDYQEDARHLGRDLGETWRALLRGQLLLAITVGVVTWIPLTIVGMPNSGGLAILAGLMEFLPTIGPGISGTIGVAIALIQGSTWMPAGNLTFAIIVLVIYAIIAQVETSYFIPKLVGGQVRLHPAVTFVGVITGALTFGLLGVLLATPIIASARILLQYVFRKLLDQDPFETAVAPQSAIRLPGVVAGRKIDGIIFDLDGTLSLTDWYFPDWADSHMNFLNPILGPQERRHIARRFMIASEGVNNFLINQMRRVRLNPNLRMPLLNRLRGFPPADKLTPQPCIGETLTTLAKKYSLALVSTRRGDEIREFLSDSNLPQGSLAIVMGREDVRNLLPNSEAYLSAAEQLELDTNQILVVSDSKMNLRSARAAQMATAGVLCGLAEEQDLIDSDLVLPDTNSLTEWM